MTFPQERWQERESLISIQKKEVNSVLIEEKQEERFGGTKSGKVLGKESGAAGVCSPNEGLNGQ